MVYYNTKLLGYVDRELLTSIKYLIDIGKWKNEMPKIDEYAYGCDDYKTRINASEFREFCELYADDLSNYYPYGEYKKEWFLEDDDIKQLMESDEDKILSWG